MKNLLFILFIAGILSCTNNRLYEKPNITMEMNVDTFSAMVIEACIRAQHELQTNPVNFLIQGHSTGKFFNVCCFYNEKKELLSFVVRHAENDETQIDCN